MAGPVATPAAQVARSREAVRKGRERLGLCALLAVALLVRVVALGRDDFWSDEVHTFDTVAPNHKSFIITSVTTH